MGFTGCRDLELYLIISIVLYQFVESDECSCSANTAAAMNEDAPWAVNESILCKPEEV